MRVFITGGTGFAGSHLVDSLLANGDEVWALVHAATSNQELPTHPRLTVVEGDLLNLPALQTLLTSIQPALIYHLAGQASPSLSWKNPALTLAVNAGGTANLLESARLVGQPRVLVVTSADMYGSIQPSDLPLTEQTVPAPRHPYGVSKWAAAQLVRLYWERYQLPVVEARPFNHIGPRQALGFVVSDFASQLAAIKRGEQPAQLSVGNLAAKRDFTDVRDVVRAYQLLGNQGQPGESYLICSGAAVAIDSILMTLIEIAGIEVTILYDPARMRPSDTPCSYGDYSKIRQHLGWTPQISLSQSLADAFANWMNFKPFHERAPR